MKKLISHICILLVTLAYFTANALDIPKGKFYFNNSLTNYSVVKFVFGSYFHPGSNVMTMTHEGNNYWSVTIPDTVPRVYQYCFAETTIPDGVSNVTFPILMDSITSRNEMHTQACALDIPVGWVFTPTSGENLTSGAWQQLGESTSYSGTLPVMFINTEDSMPITSKDEYIYAEFYIDNMGVEGFDNVGAADAPQPLEIRGRGNYTWTNFDKKSYRLKLDKKTALLGMKRNKHWALIANADDYLGFLRNTVGFEASRLLGLAWTPSQQPVEVVLNGDYIGLYMLTETVRVEPDRVNVTQQADYETDSTMVTGGWLVEIDNYWEEEQIRTIEGNGHGIFSTYKSPEHLSDEQRNYLTDLINNANAAIYVTDKNDNSWETYIDPDTLACYYIVQELLDDTESFHGSCFWHKENGDGTKMMFGPVWDFGNAFSRSEINKFIYDGSMYAQTWIAEIAKFPHFQAVVRKHWRRFALERFMEIDGFIDSFIDQIYQASICDAARWPVYGNLWIFNDRDIFKGYLHSKYDWLNEQWSLATGDVNCDGFVTAADITSIYDYLLNGYDVFKITCDVNCDGHVNSSDITALYDILLGN
jgi:hypothetical protein